MIGRSCDLVFLVLKRWGLSQLLPLATLGAFLANSPLPAAPPTAAPATTKPTANAQKETKKEVERKVRFAAAGKSGERVYESEYLLVGDDGLAACVVKQGADPKRASFGTKEQAEPADFIAFDPVSRLVLLQLPPDELDPTEVVNIGTAFDMEVGAAIWRDQAKNGAASRLVSWEGEFEQQVLPLTLMRVHHPKAVNLPVGQGLFDNQGKLIAICQQESLAYGQGTYALPAEVLSRILTTKPSEDGQIPRCWLGISLVASNKVLLIEDVQENSPAAEAGLQIGDIILRLEGKQLSSYQQAVNAFFYLTEGKEVQMEVLRGVELVQLTVTPELIPQREQPKTPTQPVPPADQTNTQKTSPMANPPNQTRTPKKTNQKQK